MARRWGNADFGELRAFSERLTQLDNLIKQEFCEKIAKELAAELLAKAIKRTPVGKKPKLDGLNKEEKAKRKAYCDGYSGGTLRRGWTAKTHQEAASGKGSGGDVASFVEGLTVTRNGDIYEILVVNPVFYASYVEYGHRQRPGRFVPALGKQLKSGFVQGRHMLTFSEKELRAEMPALIERRLAEFLEGVLNGK